jgi:hypothetical protein
MLINGFISFSRPLTGIYSLPTVRVESWLLFQLIILSDTHSVGLLWTRDRLTQTHTEHSKQTSIPPAGFEPTIPVSESPLTHVLDRTASDNR